MALLKAIMEKKLDRNQKKKIEDLFLKSFIMSLIVYYLYNYKF